MQIRIQIRTVGVIALVILLAVLGAHLAAPAGSRVLAQEKGKDGSKSPDVAELTAKAQSEGSVRLIVGLDTTFKPEGELGNPRAVQNQRRAIRQAQNAVESSLRAHNAQTVREFQYIPYMALTADTAALDTLAKHPLVTSISEDVAVPPLMEESIPLIGADVVHTAGYTGEGWAVAVLDSGVDKTHPFLLDSVVSEACYSTNNSPDVASFCPGGVESSTAPGSGMHCDVSGCDHGTHVAGTVAGRNGPDGRTGVAPDANIIAIQVFSRFDDNCGSLPTPCVLSYTSDQIAGLERVYELRNTYNIAAVNMSLGGGSFSSPCDSSDPARYTAIANLRAANIATVVASGNDGYTASISIPACLSNAVSVGATGDGSNAWNEDEVTWFSNGASFLDLLAPGALITSSVPGGGYSGFTGTSMATPHVAGAWAVLREIDSTASIDSVLDIFKTTGVSVTDTRRGAGNRVTPRIQLDAAVSLLESPPPPDAPTNLEAWPVSATEISITWDDNSFNENSFHLQRRSNGQGWATVSDNIAADTTSYIDSGRSCGTEYTYRVRSKNSRGISPWSNIDSAEPGEIQTTTYTYAGPGVAILNNETATVEIDVPDAGALNDIDIHFDATHTWVADLEIYLESPAGTRVLLVENEGFNGDNFSGTIFDDEAAQPIVGAEAPFTGRFQPEGSLLDFHGETITGIWTLEVTDSFDGDTGEITNVALDIATLSASCPTTNQNPVIAQGDTITVNMDEDSTPTAFRLTLNASDADSDTLSWKISTDPTHGTAAATGTGTSKRIRYMPDADYNGLDSFVVQVEDGNGGTDSITIDVNIAAINDAPDFTKGANIAVPMDAGMQSIPGWATNILPGPVSATDETAQALSFTLEMTSSTGSLSFDANPAIDATTGNLSFHATDATTGTVIVQVWLSDDSDGSAPHINTSTVSQFAIAVGMEGPTGILDNVSVEENTTETVIDLFAAFEDLHNSDADLTYVVQENTNPAIVSTVIDGTAGTLRLQYAPNASGTARITVRVSDADDNFIDATFEVTVNSGHSIYVPLIMQ